MRTASSRLTGRPWALAPRPAATLRTTPKRCATFGTPALAPHPWGHGPIVTLVCHSASTLGSAGRTPRGRLQRMVAEEVLNALLPCRPVLPATLRLVREQLVTVLAQHEARCETVDLKLVRPSEGNAERLLATLADRLPHINMLHMVNVRGPSAEESDEATGVPLNRGAPATTGLPGCCCCTQGGDNMFYLDSLDSTDWLDDLALAHATEAEDAAVAAADIALRPAPVHAVTTHAIYEDYDRRMARIARYACCVLVDGRPGPP